VSKRWDLLAHRKAPRALRRRALRLLWPLLLPGLLIAAAFVAGGVPGFFLGFFAALLVLDRLLNHFMGPAGWGMLEAEQSFLRLSRQRRVAGLERRLRHRPPDSDQLVYLAEDVGWAAQARRRELGLQTIAIESIVGTVDSHKAVAFDRSFRPPRWSRGRWTLMYLAARAGSQLPPISAYRAGAEHFVRDGHHRVSVARALGAAGIEAEVVELAAPRSSRSVRSHGGNAPASGWSAPGRPRMDRRAPG
jgi:hypothetical protein